MTPVTQRILASTARGDGHNGLGIAGDCMRACLASLLDLPYDQVPHFVHYGDGRPIQEIQTDDPLIDEHGALWYRRCRRWMRARGHDFGSWDLDDATIHHDDAGAVVQVDLPDELAIRTSSGMPWYGHVLLCGRSPRGEFDHVIVGQYAWMAASWDGGIRPVIVPAWDPHPSRAGLRTATAFDAVIDPYDPPPPTEAQEASA